MKRVPGIDVSRWQGKIDWASIVAEGFRFAYMRATIGKSYIDPRFYENWDNARDAGLLISAYHVVTPGIEPEAQIAHLFDTLEGREADLPLSLDIERQDNVDPETLSHCIGTCLIELERRDSRKPIIYTARWFWDRYVLPRKEWCAYDLWVASYTTSPILPRDWKTWRFWQFSDSGEVPGIRSRTVDLNWFAGNYEALVTYGKRDKHEIDSSTPEQQWQLHVLDKVNIRSGPGTSFDDLGNLYAGDVIQALALTGSEIWVEFEPGKWAAFCHKGETYMELKK